MEKLLLVLGFLTFMGLLFNNNTPGNALSLAFAGASPFNPLKNLLYSAQALVFELQTEVKDLIDKGVKELKDMAKQAQEEGKKMLEKAATKEDIEQFKADQQKKFDEQSKHLEKLQEQADALETKNKTLLSGKEQQKSFSEAMDETFTKSKDSLVKLKGDRFGSLNFGIKAAANMLISSNYSGGAVGLTNWDPEITRPALRQPFMRQLVTTRPLGEGLYVQWAEMKNRDGAVAAVAEGGAKPQIDFDIVEASAKVEKIAGFIKASKESLDDIPRLRAEINQELITEILLELDRQILLGTGTTPEMKGIMTYITSALSVTGTPFATAGASPVASPNNFDVLRVAAAIVANNNFTPNYAIVHPYDAATMELVKDANNNYVLPPFSTAGGQLVAGLRIVANSGMTLGSFLVGDLSKDILGIREEVNIQVGYVNDDFTKNLVTILGEMRAVNYIKSNNLPAFTKGVFATVKAAIAAA